MILKLVSAISIVLQAITWCNLQEHTILCINLETLNNNSLPLFGNAIPFHIFFLNGFCSQKTSLLLFVEYDKKNVKSVQIIKIGLMALIQAVYLESSK